MYRYRYKCLWAYNVYACKCSICSLACYLHMLYMCTTCWCLPIHQDAEKSLNITGTCHMPKWSSTNNHSTHTATPTPQCVLYTTLQQHICHSQHTQLWRRQSWTIQCLASWLVVDCPLPKNYHCGQPCDFLSESSFLPTSHYCYGPVEAKGSQPCLDTEGLPCWPPPEYGMCQTRTLIRNESLW